ncbi:MAG: AraC family transcriptional regulator [Pseudomonadota bacterium]
MEIHFQLALNLMLRGGAMLLLVLIAALLLRSHPRAIAARLGAAFAIGVCAFVLNTIPGFAENPPWWHAPVMVLEAGNMLVFWLFTQALLDDGFRLRRWHLAAWGLMAAAALLTCFVFVPLHSSLAAPISTALTLATIGLAALSVTQSISSWKVDLVEGRRRLRMVIVAATAGYSIFMATAALSSGDGVMAVFSSTANAAGLACISLLIAWQLMQFAGDGLFVDRQHAGNDAVMEENRPDPVGAAEAAEGPNPALVSELLRLMTVEYLYREENLSIAALAQHMELPEYKLRRLINQGLGYRNFNAFLNAYRIADASRALAASDQAEVPVLTIAMDAGFQSLGPFNRAFKAITGQTPTEFRRIHAGEAISAPAQQNKPQPKGAISVPG